jgi:hypothetical protein
VARGDGKLTFDEAETLSYNLTNPPRRDTIVIPARYVQQPEVLVKEMRQCQWRSLALTLSFALPTITLVFGLFTAISRTFLFLYEVLRLNHTYSWHLAEGFLGVIVSNPSAIEALTIPTAVTDLCVSSNSTLFTETEPGRRRRGLLSSSYVHRSMRMHKKRLPWN